VGVIEGGSEVVDELYEAELWEEVILLTFSWEESKGLDFNVLECLGGILWMFEVWVDGESSVNSCSVPFKDTDVPIGDGFMNLRI